MNSKIEGKIALVTGANRGIGEALVTALLEQGAARIYACARQIESLQPLVLLAPEVIIPLQLDVTEQGQIDAVARQLPALDLLINNAGIATASTFSEAASMEIASAEMATNYFGPINLTHALLPQLQQSQSGAVINISSIAGICNFPPLGPYSASKAALHSFTQGLRAELRTADIAVLGVYPGPVDTRLAAGSDMPKAQPAEVARIILAALENAEEDIFPDAFSQAMQQIFNANPKALEQQFAAALA